MTYLQFKNSSGQFWRCNMPEGYVRYLERPKPHLWGRSLIVGDNYNYSSSRAVGVRYLSDCTNFESITKDQFEMLWHLYHEE